MKCAKCGSIYNFRCGFCSRLFDVETTPEKSNGGETPLSHNDQIPPADVDAKTLVEYVRKNVIKDIRLMSMGMDYGAMEAFIMVADTLDKYYFGGDNGK